MHCLVYPGSYEFVGPGSNPSWNSVMKVNNGNITMAMFQGKGLPFTASQTNEI